MKGLPNPPEVQKQVDQAAKTHAGRHDKEMVVCDCLRCEGKNIILSYATVKKHRRKYGRSGGVSAPSINAPPSPVPQTSRRSVSRAPSARDAPPRHSAAKPYAFPLDLLAAVPLSRWSQSMHLPDPQAIDQAPHFLPVVSTNEARGESSNQLPILDPHALSLPDAQSNEGTEPAQEDYPIVPDSELIDNFRLVYRPSDHIPHEKSLTPTLSRLPSPDPLVPSLELAPWDDTDAFMPVGYGRNSPSIRSDDWDDSESPPFPPQHSNNHLAFYEFVLDENCSPATPMADLPEITSDDDALYGESLLEDDHDIYPGIAPNQLLDENLGDQLYAPRPPGNHGNPAPDQEYEPHAEHGSEESESDTEPRFHDFLEDAEEDLELEDPEPGDDGGCSAFNNDPPDFRNFFIRTYMQSAFRGATNESIAEILATQYDFLLELNSRGELAQELSDRLPMFPLTLRALQRRLGIDFTRLIKVYSLCPKCGTRYNMEYIHHATSPACPHPTNGGTCGETLYTVSTLHGGKKKHSPTRSFPYVSLCGSLECQLSRPAFPEVCQMWRHGGDEVGKHPPMSYSDWTHTMHANVPFGQQWDGWEWRNHPIGLNRAYNEGTGVYGDELEDELCSLAHLPVGLNLSINIDGFRVHKKADYSVQGVYVVINNLPVELRHRHENMILVCVMPGPKEPSNYEFNQILEPLVDELIELSKGVEMQIYSQATNQLETQLVYAGLGALVIDYISRIKCNGHAGTKSENHFCLYCPAKRSHLSVPAGFKRDGLVLRDPQKTLQQKYDWLHAPNEQKEQIRRRTGVTFTEFDRIPGFYGSLHSPIDGMHLFHLGLDPWIFIDTLLKPGMFDPWDRNQSEAESPRGLLKAALADIYWPSHCKRLPTDPDNFTSSMKAEQWHHFDAVAHILLFKAWRVGDTIPDMDIPRGHANSTSFKWQERQAGLVYDARCRVARELDDENDLAPTRADCYASRNPKLYYRNILRYVAALGILMSRMATPSDISLAQRLLERMAISFTRMNVHLSPSFHYAMHVEPFILKYGSLHNTWAYPFERANLQLQTTNNNNHGLGVLETTMARAFLKRGGFYQLLHRMQDIPNPTHNDTKTIEAMLKVLPDGPEHEHQRGLLDAILAGERSFRIKDRTRLAATPAKVNFMRENRAHYDLVVNYCSQQLPGIVVYGSGRRPHGGVYLHPTESTKSYSHLLQCGTRFGVADSYRGNRSRFGYIFNYLPVIIRQIYRIQLNTADDDEHELICAVIQRFRRCHEQVVFPWDLWKQRLQTDSWLYQEFEPPEVVSVDALTGVFAMLDLQMSHSHCWITRAMPNMKVEDLDPEN